MSATTRCQSGAVCLGAANVKSDGYDISRNYRQAESVTVGWNPPRIAKTEPSLARDPCGNPLLRTVLAFSLRPSLLTACRRISQAVTF